MQLIHTVTPRLMRCVRCRWKDGDRINTRKPLEIGQKVILVDVTQQGGDELSFAWKDLPGMSIIHPAALADVTFMLRMQS